MIGRKVVYTLRLIFWHSEFHDLKIVSLYGSELSKGLHNRNVDIIYYTSLNFNLQMCYKHKSIKMHF
jgi:hypothetical protein